MAKKMLSRLAGSLLAMLAMSVGQAGAEPVGKLVLEVIEGEGARNQISKRKAERPLVRVLDRNGNPVEGAEVVFQSPSGDTASAFFGLGEHRFVSVTDQKGRARVGKHYRPNDVPGAFQMEVTAKYGDLTGQTRIGQTNVLGPGANRRSRSLGVTMLVLGGVSLVTVLLAL